MLLKSLRTLVLTLSLGLSFSLYAVPSSTGPFNISNITFHDIKGAELDQAQLFYSVLGLSKNNTYSKDDISGRVKKLEEMIDYKVVDWDFNKGTLDVVVSVKKIVDSVDITGNKVLHSSDILDEAGFKIKGAYCEDVCDAFAQKVRKLYADHGFYKTTVDLTTGPLPEDRVKVTVNVIEGDPARISSVNMDVQGYVSKNKLMSILDVKPGERISYSKVHKNLKRIREYLFDSRYYSSSIYKSTISVDKDMASASIDVGVSTGPRFSLVFYGNNTITNVQTLTTALDMAETDVVSKDYYPVLANRIEDFYVNKGFGDAKVTVHEELGLKEGELTLVFVINEGARKYFRNVDFVVKGDSDKNDKLADYVKRHKPDLFDNGFFIKKEFDDIKNIIEQYFNEKGHLRSRIVSLTFKERHKGFIDIVYDIDAGQETIIRNIEVTGNKALKSDEVLSELNIKEGAPIRLDELGTNINKLAELYHSKGYSDFRIDKDKLVTYSENYRFADIRAEIYEGRKYKIGRVFIEGLSKTKDRVVTREFKFKRDGKIDPRELQETENNLASLGVFGGVSVSLLPVGVDGEDYKDVLVKLQEKNAGLYEVGFGYRTDTGIKVSSGISYNNLGGWNRRIYADGSLSRRLDNQFKFIEYDVNTGYYEPYLFNLPLDFRVNIEARKDDLPAYGQKKLDLAFYLEKTFGSHTLILRNAVERVSIFDSQVPEDNGAYWKYSLRPIYRFDTRNSVFNPTRGLNLLVYGEWGHSIKSVLITDYVKFEERARLYVPIFKNWTFVPAFDAGYIKGLKGDSILLDERFKLGGSDNLRGYRENIINDLTPQISSQSYYIFTLELRRTLFWKFVGNVFHDIGSMSSEDPSIDGPFASIGGGISIKFPVGALSLQYGYVYDWTKRIPADKVGRIHFSIGTF